MTQLHRVQYQTYTSTEKLFHNEDAAKAFAQDIRDKGEIALLDMQPELKEMGEHPVSMDAVNILIRNPTHFMRTIEFAEANGLSDQFNKTFAQLMHLLAGSKGQAELWPDGFREPSFGWAGCGMVGGFIFHRSSREWSIHT